MRAAAAATPAASHVNAATGIPATRPNPFQEPTVRSVNADACDLQVAVSTPHRERCGQQESAQEDRQAEDAEVRQGLHVGVLDAPRVRRGRKRPRGLVEAPLRSRHVRLIGVLVRRPLPADAEQRVTEEDPAADVGEKRSLAVALDVLRCVAVPLLDPDELETVRHGLASDPDNARGQCDDDPGDSDDSPPVAPGRECTDGDRGEHESEQRVKGAPEDHPAAAGDPG